MNEKAKTTSENKKGRHGQARLEPSLLPANSSHCSFKLIYTVGGPGIRKGGGIRFLFPCQVINYEDKKRIEVPVFNNWWYTLNPWMYTKKFYGTESPAGVKVKIEETGLIKSAKWTGRFLYTTWRGKPVFNLKDMHHAVSAVGIRVVKGELAPGQEIAIQVGAGDRLKTPHYPTVIDVAVETDADGSGDYQLIEKSPALKTYGRVRELLVFAPSTPRPGEKFQVKVMSGSVDIYPEPDPTYTAKIQIESNGLQLPSSVNIGKGDGGQKSFKASAPRDGLYWITVRDEAGGFQARSNPIECRKEGPRLYWGDIHTQSILSDGEWKPETVFTHMRDHEHLDFAAVTDHDLNLVTYYMVKDRDLSRIPKVRHELYKWRCMERTAEAFDSPGQFVTLVAYEWTHHEQGHRNIYFKPGTARHFIDHLDERGLNADKLLDSYKDAPVIIIPHHTAWRGGEEMGDKIEWGKAEHKNQKLLEIYSQHGADEFHGNPFPIHARSIMFLALPRGTDDDGNPSRKPPWYIPIKGYQPTDAAEPGIDSYAQEILAKGRKFTLICGSDAHYASYYKMSYPNGRMAAWMQALKSENLWNAMDAGLVYGTTGPRIIMEFYVAGRPMGSELELVSPLPLKGKVIGTLPLKTVEVVRYHQNKYDTAFCEYPEKEYYEFEFNDYEFKGKGFYYLRTTQTDGNQGWAGPVWINAATGSEPV